MVGEEEGLERAREGGRRVEEEEGLVKGGC